MNFNGMNMYMSNAIADVDLKSIPLRIGIVVDTGCYYSIGIMNFLKRTLKTAPSSIDIFKDIDALFERDLNNFDLLVLDKDKYMQIEELPLYYMQMPIDSRLRIVLTCLNPCKLDPTKFRYKGIKGIMPLSLDVTTFGKYINYMLDSKNIRKAEYLLYSKKREYEKLIRKVDNKSEWVKNRVRLIELNYGSKMVH